MEISESERVAFEKIFEKMPGLLAILRDFKPEGDCWIWTGRSSMKARLFEEILKRRRLQGRWGSEPVVETEHIPSVPWRLERGGRRI
jgi:hypothetical protein